ncbi:hypothetical protein INT80_04675 [Gallibacterium anatis]|uniref:Uncharacterized protein n=1 Tax=Gallibacterium anatis TaxID=750 RepID=A0A930Y8H7_9PAST|nr:hypothetical protein [Gallibacterium anatis]
MSGNIRERTVNSLNQQFNLDRQQVREFPQTWPQMLAKNKAKLRGKTHNTAKK